MKILFDQGTPVPLRRALTGHTVDTAYERGWSALTNGDLLAIAEQDGYQDDHDGPESPLSAKSSQSSNCHYRLDVYILARDPASH
jgi:hypothetical protein